MLQIGSISSKGQVVIPVDLRRKFNLRPRTKVVFGEQDGKLTMESTALDEVLALRGCLSDVGEDLETLLMEERRKDRERDERKFAELL